MDALRLLSLVAANPEVEDARIVIADVDAYVRKRHVRVVVFDNGDLSNPYRFTADVYDRATGDLLATGNGAESVDVALSIVHWNEVRPLA